MIQVDKSLKIRASKCSTTTHRERSDSRRSSKGISLSKDFKKDKQNRSSFILVTSKNRQPVIVERR